MNEKNNKEKPFKKILNEIQGKPLKVATMEAQKIGKDTQQIVNGVNKTIQNNNTKNNVKTPGYIDGRKLDEDIQRNVRTLDDNFQNNGQFAQQFNEINNFYGQQNYGEYRQQEDRQQRNDDIER